MSSPFYFPDEDSRYQGMFRENYERGPASSYDYSSYLDPDDEEVRKLRDIYSQPSGASELVREYIGKRPDQADYNPSFGRKLLAFVGGTFGGGDGYNRSRQILNQPYTDDYKSWSDEGKFIDDQVRLLEADRSREIQAIKLGIQEKGKLLAQKNRNTTSAFNFAQRGANQQSLDQDRDASRMDANNRFSYSQEGINRRFDENQEGIQGRFDENQESIQGRFDKRLDSRVNPDNPVKELANERAIDELVLRQAESIPVFKPIMDFIKSEEAKGNTPNLIALAKTDPQMAQLIEHFKYYLQSQAQVRKGRK